MKTFLQTLFFLIILISVEGAGAQNNPFLKARAAFEQNQYQTAVELLNQHISNYPKHVEALLYRAKANLELKQYQQSIDDLNLLKSSVYPEIILMQARAFAAIGNNKQAFEKLEQYRNLSNKTDDVSVKQYVEFQSLKQSLEWHRLWSKWTYSEKENALNNSKYAIKSGRTEEAIDRLSQFTAKYKTSDEAFSLLGELYFKKKDYKNALECFNQALNLNGSNPDYLVWKGMVLNKSGKYKSAKELFTQVLRNDSLQISAKLGRAESNFALNFINEASHDIADFLSYYPYHEEAQFIDAQISTRLGDYLSAISGFGKLIKNNPSKPEYFVGRADAYMATKTYQYAIKDYSMALDLSPKDIEIHRKKAKAHQLSGDIKNACINWEFAVRLGDMESMRNIQKYCK